MKQPVPRALVQLGGCTKARSVILTKGQSAVTAFSSADTDEYICGPHPNMKASVEVK